MRFVHIEPIHTELFKGHNVVLAVGILQLFQLRLQVLFRALQFLNGEALSITGFQLSQTILNFVDLLPQKPFLPFHGYGYPFKLAVPDDNRVIVSGGDTGAELLAVPFFKVLFGGNENVCGGIQPQKLRRPLFRKVIRNSKQGLVTEAETLALHGGRHHLKGLSRAHFVRQQRIRAV